MIATPRRTAVAAVTAVTVLSLGLAACTSVRDRQWSHPDVPRENWSVDAAQCRYEARREAEDELLRDTGGSGVDISENSVDAYLDRASYDKRVRALFGECMRALGYVSEQ